MNSSLDNRGFGNLYAEKKQTSMLKWLLRKYIFPLIPTLRIPPVSQINLDRALRKQFKRLNPEGVVLDVGSWDSPYKKQIPHSKYMTLDIDPQEHPDICCDIHKIKWKPNYFDTIIVTEVLEHLYNPQKAINELHKILKPGGVCILSTRFIFPFHPVPKDYYRFTWDSLEYLFRNFSHVEIYSHGNKLQVLWQIINYRKSLGVFLNIFNYPLAMLPSTKTLFPLGFIVYAKK
jgi:SAM-dependent methyltransferase